jgi:hypothetical protein
VHGSSLAVILAVNLLGVAVRSFGLHTKKARSKVRKTHPLLVVIELSFPCSQQLSLSFCNNQAISLSPERAAGEGERTSLTSPFARASCATGS